MSEFLAIVICRMCYYYMPVAYSFFVGFDTNGWVSVNFFFLCFLSLLAPTRRAHARTPRADDCQRAAERWVPGVVVVIPIVVLFLMTVGCWDVGRAPNLPTPTA
ncbi:hypothetical protein B0J12DRAFT_671298 [Macrophomina phaseolina]|uniref:Uncharacterized protein n=1 Tax=Macrophomina phaseolina TaxID=35725 RepID=A0ABQ8G3U8_9PEZI|nr:hypothetical protein B0J12DRAFT_671298 [Macrophomina phaseolina]